MLKIINRIPPSYLLSIIVFISFACQLEPAINPKPSGAKQSDIHYSLIGSVTDTWGWGPGSYTCDTQDEMKLTINYANGAVLTLHGACFYSSSGFESCTEQSSTLPCGLVIYGTYSYAANRVTFTACNKPDAANGSGKVDMRVGPGDSLIILDGDVDCAFSNTNETHHIKFTAH
jgi:hypothetical protein